MEEIEAMMADLAKQFGKDGMRAIATLMYSLGSEAIITLPRGAKCCCGNTSSPGGRQVSEFGHVYGSGYGMRFDSWGVGPYIIADENGKQYRFEDSDRFGPFLIGKKGDPLAPQPGTRSPFWRAHSIWVQQGRRTTDKINCVWDEPKPTTVQMLSKRVGIVVEHGDENGKVIRVALGPQSKPQEGGA